MATTSFRAGAFVAAGLATALSAGGLDGARAASAIDNWPTRPGTAVRVLLTKASQPTDAVMLLPGGHGNINLDSRGHIGWGEDDFVIRSRWYYFDHGIATIVPDVAADHKPPASLAGFRTSTLQADDLSALSQRLHDMAPKVWIVAYDTGATSALNAIAHGKADLIAGLALVSPVLGQPRPDGTLLIDGLKLAIGRMPVLVIAHQADACSAPDVERIKQTAAAVKAVNFRSIAVTGGSAQALRDPFAYAEGSCNTQAPHRLAGLDEVVTDKIIDWIRGAGSTASGDALSVPPAVERRNTPPLVQATPLSTLPTPGMANFRWMTLRGLNAQAVNADAVVPGQPVLRLIATPDSKTHTLAVRLSGLDKGRTYRIAAWVKPVAGGNANLAAFDRPDSDQPSDSGDAIFDLENHKVLKSSGATERDIEQHSDAWQKVWIDLPTVDGEFLIAVRPIKGTDYQFDGDGRLGVLFGGIEAQRLD